uniref:Uncharacterized protein n=1 Tax=Melopsittacus undulatus TaxID=13146 RepID=A0A8V5GUV4_MELUD
MMWGTPPSTQTPPPQVPPGCHHQPRCCVGRAGRSGSGPSRGPMGYPSFANRFCSASSSSVSPGGSASIAGGPGGFRGSFPRTPKGRSCLLGGKCQGWLLTVGFGHTLQLILLLDGIRVGRALEGRDQGWRWGGPYIPIPNGNVTTVIPASHPPHLGSIDELIRQALCNGLDVAERGFPGAGAQQPNGLMGKVDDLEGVLDDAHGHELLPVIPAVHHHGVGEPLHNGTLGFAEALGRVAPGAVGSGGGSGLLKGRRRGFPASYPRAHFRSRMRKAEELPSSGL